MAINNPFGASNKSDQTQSATDNQHQGNTVNDEQRNDPSANVYSPFSQLGQSAVMGQLIPANGSSEKFTQIFTALSKQVAAVKAAADVVEVVPFPREQHGKLYFSVIAMVRNIRKALPQTTDYPAQMIVQLLIIEATNDQPRSLIEETGTRGQTFNIERTSEDANNDKLVTYVTGVLLEQYKLNKDQIRFIDPIVVPRDFDPEKEANIRILASESSMAVQAVAITRHKNFQDWNVIESLGRNQDLTLPVSVELINDRFITNSLSQPVAADIEVSVSMEAGGRNRRNRDDLNDSTVENTICRTSVLMEMIPVSTDLLREQAEQRRGRQDRDLRPEAGFLARANIVNINQAMTRTEGGVLFSIASVAEIGREQRIWAELYRGRRGDSSNVNFYDAGALNYEANIKGERNFGTKVATDDPEFGDHELGRFLDLVVLRQLAIGLDCPTSGPTAWYTTPFAALARGTQDQRDRARDTILAAAIRLTDGKFRDYFDPRDDILLGEGTRIWLGHWYDAQGNKRDIREFTYLPIANLVGESNPDMIRQWVDTRLNTSLPEDQRMSEELDILNALTNRGVSITGTAIRNTVAGVFVNALVDGLRAAKAPLRSRGTDLGSRFEQRRSIASGMADALISTGGFGRAGSSDRRDFGANWGRNSTRY